MVYEHFFYYYFPKITCFENILIWYMRVNEHASLPYGSEVRSAKL